jgi:hypothetical protein
MEGGIVTKAKKCICGRRPTLEKVESGGGATIYFRQCSQVASTGSGHKIVGGDSYTLDGAMACWNIQIDRLLSKIAGRKEGE